MLKNLKCAVALALSVLVSACATTTSNIALEAGNGPEVYDRAVYPPWRKMAVAFNTEKAEELQILNVPVSAETRAHWDKLNFDDRAILYPTAAAAKGGYQTVPVALQSKSFRTYIVRSDGSYAPTEAIWSPSGRQLIVLLPPGVNFAGMSAFIRSDRGDAVMTLDGTIIDAKNQTTSELYFQNPTRSVISRTLTVKRGDGSQFFELALDGQFPENSRIGGHAFSGTMGTFCSTNNGWCDLTPVERGKGGRFPSIAGKYTREDRPVDRWITCGNGNISTGLLSWIGLGLFVATNVNTMFAKDRC